MSRRQRPDWEQIRKAAERSEPLMKRMSYARAHPDDPKSEPFLSLGSLTPRELEPVWRFLPDPLRKRGRRKGGDTSLVDELERLIAVTGERPTTVARRLTGEDAYTKPKADYLVKQLNNRRRIK